ncbi:hypothetical protein P7C73_g1970, partial [Tremellales sp. Uapishka_1]
MPFGFTHKPLVGLASSAISSFFRKIEVFGEENVPTEGPIIFACSHANMAIDPAVLSSTMPHGLSVHYWVKDSLFSNPAVGALLRNAGNIVLALGESIGVFPEGTSHTEPRMIALKDGVSWTALEYLRYLQGTEENGGPKSGTKAVIVPVGIAYVNKNKYRSRVAVHYGEPITMDDYQEEFMSEADGADKSAVKRLTRRVDFEIRKFTVNSPDWDTAFAASMARELLWEEEEDLALADYVDVTQTLVDLFSTSSIESIESLKNLLVTYHKLLISSRLSNTALTRLPLPQTLDPTHKTSLPNRFSTLFYLLRDSLTSMLRLPFFLIPMLIHLPIYVVGILGGHLAVDEIETQAQTKVTFGIILSFLTYPVLFFTLWAIFKQFTLGFAIAAGAVWMFARYHAVLIDQNYDAMKRLVAAWRILIGVWIPKSSEMPLPSFIADSSLFAPNPPAVVGLPPSIQPEKWVKPKHVPSRVLVRHVLRLRIEAARELASVLLDLEASDESLHASYWLAEEAGGEVLKASKEDEEKLEWERPIPTGVRGGREVVGYLREKGARLGYGNGQGGGGAREGHWAAAASSGDESER